MAREQAKTERNFAICKDRRSGMMLKDIARKYGIAICRVQQIIKAWDGRAYDQN